MHSPAFGSDYLCKLIPNLGNKNFIPIPQGVGSGGRKLFNNKHLTNKC